MSREDGPSSRGDGSQAVSREEFQRLFSAIGDMQSQLTSMKRDLSQDRVEADDRLVKRLRLERKTSFKKKDNEKQYDFNEEVREKLATADSSLNAAPPDIDKAKSALQEGEKLINERQKLIKVADRSEYGWATQEEYTTDELADNSDDEKRLFKAEARAGKKLKTAKAKNKKPLGSKRASYLTALQKAANIPSQGSQGLQSPGLMQSREPSGSQLGRVQPAVVVPCVQCGTLGHFRRNCPLLSTK